jgi:hypothetical protein
VSASKAYSTVLFSQKAFFSIGSRGDIDRVCFMSRFCFLYSEIEASIVRGIHWPIRCTIIIIIIIIVIIDITLNSSISWFFLFLGSFTT